MLKFAPQFTTVITYLISKLINIEKFIKIKCLKMFQESEN